MGKHHTENNSFRIFSLIQGEYCFIGKTVSPNISAVYSRHRRGNVAATRGVMDQEQSPSLHILEQMKSSGEEAYRHVVAWVRLFEENGYRVINRMRTLVDAELLYPATEMILKRIQKEPLSNILERTYLEKPRDGNLKLFRQRIFQPKREKHVQMNLRMPEKDKKTFDRFCAENHLKPREALGVMLDQMGGDDYHQQLLLSEQKALRQENDQLKEKLAIHQGRAFPAQEQRAIEYVRFLKMGFSEYLQYLFTEAERKPLPSFPYKRFQKQTKIRYEYPAFEGFVLLTAEAMLWGKNHSRFIVGHDQNGEYRKVRYYPKPLYAGALIWEYPVGTQWVVGVRRAADGAMEVAAAFPLPASIRTLEDERHGDEREYKPSIDDQIYSALMNRK